MTRPTLTLIGAPISAGAHHGGLEQTPARLRELGLPEQLARAGFDVLDAGDVTTRLFTLDAHNPTARNAALVAAGIADVSDAVSNAIDRGTIPLVLGGDCTVTLGVIAGMQTCNGDVGLLYLDGNADLVTPETTRSGILDAMVVAHLLGEATSPLSRAPNALTPLAPDRVALLGYDETDIDSFDAAVLAKHGRLFHRSDRELAKDPAGTARAARRAVERPGRAIAVHFDVDAVDSADLPLADFPHYGAGLSLTQTMDVMAELVSTRSLAALALTEVNCTYDPTGIQQQRYVDAVVDALHRGIGGGA